MSIVTLVRHGQANTGATDEDSYDNLSKLGRQQAAWLGDYLAGNAHGVRRIIAGSMRRQQQTASYIATALGLSVAMDRRLNEINYFALTESLQARTNRQPPTCREEFLEHLPMVMASWEAGEIESPDETFAEYQQRVQDILAEAELSDGTMLVTSGGVIGMAMRNVLGLNTDSFAHVLLQINNASTHRYQIEHGARRLMTFNATPHLDAHDRVETRTYV